MHISPTPNLKPLKQNNVHKIPYRFSVHKTTNPMFTKHTNHETPDTRSPILHSVHEAPKNQCSKNTRDLVFTKYNTQHYYSTHEAPWKALGAINNVHENLLNKASHKSHNWWKKKNKGNNIVTQPKNLWNKKIKLAQKTHLFTSMQVDCWLPTIKKSCKFWHSFLVLLSNTLFHGALKSWTSYIMMRAHAFSNRGCNSIAN